MKIYIGNISRTTTEDALREAFEKFGEVLSVKVIKDRETNEPRGFAFVEMEDEKAQEAINSLNGSELDGSRLHVNEARPQGDRPFRSPRPGGGSRGGFGGNRTGGGSRGGFGGGSSRDGGSRGGFGGRDRSSKFNSNSGGWR